ncbi:hypothetical protein H4582DRAFT_2059552 [Lactarius indigo]|nr:hypothetical protein H4582DRAFT_2059552 [Lactarius indigo]
MAMRPELGSKNPLGVSLKTFEKAGFSRPLVFVRCIFPADSEDVKADEIIGSSNAFWALRARTPIFTTPQKSAAWLIAPLGRWLYLYVYEVSGYNGGGARVDLSASSTNSPNRNVLISRRNIDSPWSPVTTSNPLDQQRGQQHGPVVHVCQAGAHPVPEGTPRSTRRLVREAVSYTFRVGSIGIPISEAIRPVKPPRAANNRNFWTAGDHSRTSKDDRGTSAAARDCQCQLATWILMVLVYYAWRVKDRMCEC